MPYNPRMKEELGLIAEALVEVARNLSSAHSGCGFEMADKALASKIRAEA